MNIKYLVFVCSLQATSHILSSSSDPWHTTMAVKEGTGATVSALTALTKAQSVLAEAQKQRDTYLHNEIQTTRTEVQAIRIELQETKQTLREMLTIMQAHTEFIKAWIPHISKQLESE